MKKNNTEAINYTNSKILLRDVFRAVDFFGKVSKTKIESLSISFVADSEMAEMNMKHLSHKGSTDIITFDYSDKPDVSTLDGEIIICVDEAKRHSKIYQVTLSDELNRLLFHGLLHLTGYDDINTGKRKVMKAREDEILTLWNQFNLKKLK
jgi:rRNA maturation RNase YbeY